MELENKLATLTRTQQKLETLQSSKATSNANKEKLQNQLNKLTNEKTKLELNLKEIQEQKLKN